MDGKGCDVMDLTPLLIFGAWSRYRDFGALTFGEALRIVDPQHDVEQSLQLASRTDSNVGYVL
jgi:hypothetical protein